MPTHFITAINQLYHPNAIVLTTAMNMTIPNGIFSRKELAYLNVNSLLPKIDKFASLQNNQVL